MWIDAFFDVLATCEVAEPLKAAAIDERLADWTRLLTAAVVQACARTGWVAAAKGHRLALLPKVGQEYLGLDAMAFCPPSPSTPAVEGADRRVPIRWPVPVAVFELENSRDDDRVAYSVWKVLCVRAPLRVVFAYRGNWDAGRALVQELAQTVIEPMPIAERTGLGGDTLLFVGSRGEGETFPHGFFKIWQLDSGLAAFRRIT
jgi:hypothetical protein